MRGYCHILILGLVACVTFTSCSRLKYVDNSSLTIVPGLGISNVVEIGMTLPVIKKNTGDLTIQEYHSQHVSAIEVRIPSLGAIWEQEKRNMPVREIHFVVDPSSYANESPLHSFPSFRGSIAGGLTFSKERVKREDVVKVFGQPAYNIDEYSVAPDSIRDAWKQRQSLLANGQPVASRTAENIEVVYYPNHGIIFTLQSNFVYSIVIRKAKRAREERSGGRSRSVEIGVVSDRAVKSP